MDFFKSVEEINSPNAKKYAEEMLEGAAKFVRILNAYYGKEMFGEPVFYGRSDTYMLYESDGNTPAKGTEYVVNLGYPLLVLGDCHIESWELYEQKAFGVLGFYFSVARRNRDDKTNRHGLGEPRTSVWFALPYGSDNNNRITYRSYNVELVAQEVSAIVRRIDAYLQEDARIKQLDKIIDNME